LSGLRKEAAVHPIIAEALVTARQADIERAARAPRHALDDGRPVRAGVRRPARVAVGMRLIDLGLRLVDITPATRVC
jgi:hypothetical protein